MRSAASALWCVMAFLYGAGATFRNDVPGNGALVLALTGIIFALIALVLKETK